MCLRSGFVSRFVSSFRLQPCGGRCCVWRTRPSMAPRPRHSSISPETKRCKTERTERFKKGTFENGWRSLILSSTFPILYYTYHIFSFNLFESCKINIQFNVCSYHNRCFSNEMKIKTCENKHMERWELWYAAVHSDTWWCRYVSDIDQIFIRYVSGHIRSIITYMVWYS